MSNPWNDRYNRIDYFYGEEPNSFLADNIRLFPQGGKILSLAEGEGRNAVFLARAGFRVTAVDYSQVGLDKLKRLADTYGVSVETICADLHDFSIGSNEWDGIVSVWCHLPKQLRRKVYIQVCEGLKSGGIFITESYTPDQLKYKTGGPQDPDLLPTLSQLEQELALLHPEFKQETLREIHEGIGHNGMSSVVQFIGRKK